MRSALDPLTARPLSAAIRARVSTLCVRVMVHACVCIKEGASEDLASRTLLRLFELGTIWTETASIRYQGIEVGLEGFSCRSRLLVNALHHLPFAKLRDEGPSQAHKGNTCAACHALRAEPLPPPSPRHAWQVSWRRQDIAREAEPARQQLWGTETVWRHTI